MGRTWGKGLVQKDAALLHWKAGFPWLSLSQFYGCVPSFIGRTDRDLVSFNHTLWFPREALQAGLCSAVLCLKEILGAEYDFISEAQKCFIKIWKCDLIREIVSGPRIIPYI